MVGKSPATLAGGEQLRVVNFGLSLPPSSDQFWIITTNAIRQEKNAPGAVGMPALEPTRFNELPNDLEGDEGLAGSGGHR